MSAEQRANLQFSVVGVAAALTVYLASTAANSQNVIDPLYFDACPATRANGGRMPAGIPAINTIAPDTLYYLSDWNPCLALPSIVFRIRHTYADPLTVKWEQGNTILSYRLRQPPDEAAEDTFPACRDNSQPAGSVLKYGQRPNEVRVTTFRVMADCLADAPELQTSITYPFISETGFPPQSAITLVSRRTPEAVTYVVSGSPGGTQLLIGIPSLPPAWDIREGSIPYAYLKEISASLANQSHELTVNPRSFSASELSWIDLDSSSISSIARALAGYNLLSIRSPSNSRSAFSLVFPIRSSAGHVAPPGAVRPDAHRDDTTGIHGEQSAEIIRVPFLLLSPQQTPLLFFQTVAHAAYVLD